MYPVIIQNNIYYYPLNTSLPVNELDGAKVKFSGMVIERIPASLDENFTQIYVELTYIETAETITFLELSLIPIFLIIPMSIFLLLDFLGDR